MGKKAAKGVGLSQKYFCPLLIRAIFGQKTRLKAKIFLFPIMKGEKTEKSNPQRSKFKSPSIGRQQKGPFVHA